MSWSAHFDACRRDTRLDTAVAVPATTAVLAMPRTSPISTHLRWGRLGLGVDHERPELRHDVCGDPELVEELAVRVPHGVHERDRPEVLDGEERHRAVRFEVGSDLLGVLG